MNKHLCLQHGRNKAVCVPHTTAPRTAPHYWNNITAGFTSPLSDHGPCFPAALRRGHEEVKERVAGSLTLILDVTRPQPRSATGAPGTELPLSHGSCRGARAPPLLRGHFYLHENKVHGIPHNSHRNEIPEGHTPTGEGRSLQRGREAARARGKDPVFPRPPLSICSRTHFVIFFIVVKHT